MRLKRKPLPKRGAFLGSGHFSTVYAVGAGRVLKVCRGGEEIRASSGEYVEDGHEVMDAGLDWALYCMKAWRTLRSGHAALRNLPRVHEVGLLEDGYWVVMDRYVSARDGDKYLCRPTAERACWAMFKHEEVDVHDANVMRCPTSGRVVLTDPFSHTSAVAYGASRSLRKMLA